MRPDDFDRDREVSVRLDRLEGSAHWLQYDAQQIQSALVGLEQRRPFETRARDALNICETNLRTALALVKTAQEIYDNLPVDLTDYSLPKQEQAHEHQ